MTPAIFLPHLCNALQAQRASFVQHFANTFSILAGRTGTRSLSGRPKTRYEESVKNARSYKISRQNEQPDVAIIPRLSFLEIRDRIHFRIRRMSGYNPPHHP